MRLLIFCSFFSLSIVAQDKLYLKDGNIIEGSIIFILEDFVKIQDESTGKRKTFSKRKIERLVETAEFFDNDDDYLYGGFNIYKKAMLNLDSIEYKIKKISWRELRSPVAVRSKWLVGKLISGKVSLYVGHTEMQGFRVTRYFLHRVGEEEMESITFNERGFRKRVSKYFKDCKGLSQNIENKKYKYDDLFKIIELYNNNNCEI